MIASGVTSASVLDPSSSGMGVMEAHSGSLAYFPSSPRVVMVSVVVDEGHGSAGLLECGLSVLS